MMVTVSSPVFSKNASFVKVFGTNAQPASARCKTNGFWAQPNKHFAKQNSIYIDESATSCNELFTWADVYDTANHDERRAILQQFITEIRVRKDYEISITLNASFNQVEQLKAVSTYDGAEIFEEISEKGA